MPKEVLAKGIFWRLIFGRYASLQELREHWTLIDVLDFNDVLDANEAAERLYIEANRRKK